MSIEEFVVRRRSGLLETEIDGELVGLHIDNGTCYGFNATATRIWSLIEAPTSVSALRDVLTAEFDVDPATCEAELMSLLRDLEADGLVELQPVPQIS